MSLERHNFLSLKINFRARFALIKFFFRKLNFIPFLSKTDTYTTISFEYFQRRQFFWFEFHSSAAIGFFGIPSNVEPTASSAIGKRSVKRHDWNPRLELLRCYVPTDQAVLLSNLPPDPNTQLQWLPAMPPHLWKEKTSNCLIYYCTCCPWL